MNSTVEALEGNMVKLQVEVDEAEFDQAMDAAFRKIAHQVRIPGFRAGKAPRRVLENYVGPAAARQQALQDGIPEFLSRAVREHDIDIIAPPKVDLDGGAEDGPVSFTAEIQVRPQVLVPGYDALRVEMANPKPTDAEIDAQIERMRQPGAKVNDVERPVVDGDLVVVDLVGSREGNPLPGLNVTEYSYLVGSGQIVPELDAELIGTSAGDEFDFTAPHPVEGQDPIDFDVVIKRVQERVLPEANDEWASENSDFETLTELRADLTKRLHLVRAVQTQMGMRDRIVEALSTLVTEDVPDVLVTSDLQQRAEDIVMRVQQQGLTLDQWLAYQGKETQEFANDLKGMSTTAVKADLALRAVANAESITIDDEEIDAEFERMAAQSKQKVKKIRTAYERNDAMSSLIAEMRKRKAVEWLVEHCEIVDPEGNPIPKEDLTPAAINGEDATDEA
jgi:trigger factor